MAAEVLADAGCAVSVYDHMPSVGRKFLLAGRGGLNITHSEDVDRLLERYRGSSPAIARAIERFNPTDLRAWCAGLGEPTFIGTSGRVFPKSFRATPLLRAWLQRLDDLNVAVYPRHRWLGWKTTEDGQQIHQFQTVHDEATSVHADVTILALGGASWPRVGSNGEWVSTVRDRSIHVLPLRPSNCGVRVEWTAGFANRFAGQPLKNIAMSLAHTSARGDAMITTDGLEGGPVYALSADIRDAIESSGHGNIRIDLQPDLTIRQIARRLDRRRPKDSLSSTLRRTVGLTPSAIAVLREATENQIPLDAVALAELIKEVPFRIAETMGIDRAISSAGGIASSELTEDLMLRNAPGIFAAGEMLDWEAPTGGYLLQATLSTAVLAARGAIAWTACAAT